MAARQTVIIGGIALAAVLAGILWYQLSTQPAEQATASPTPRPIIAASSTPTPTTAPAAQAEGPTPTILEVQASAETGSTETVLALAGISALIGAVLLGYTITSVQRLSN